MLHIRYRRIGFESIPGLFCLLPRGMSPEDSTTLCALAGVVGEEVLDHLLPLGTGDEAG